MFAQTGILLKGGDISSNMVNHIFQDHEGIVWISTENGLNRQDGAKNTVIFSEKDNNSNFSSTFEDSKHRKWVCASEHVMLYNDATESLTPIQAILDDGKAISIRGHEVIELKDGTIMTYTSGHGIFELVEKNGKMEFRQNRKHIPYYYISSMVQDAKGRLWATTEEGVICWDGKIHHIDCGDKNNISNFSSVIIGVDNNIWVSNDVNGVWVINPKTMQAKVIEELAGLPVSCLLSKIKDGVLAGTNGYGVFEINTKTLATSQFPLRAGNLYDNHLNVHHLMNDKEDNLWAACYQKGVIILPHEERRFDHIGQHNFSGNLIGTNCVMALTSDSRNILWVACDGDGIYAINNGKSTHYAPLKGKMPRTVMAMYCDSKDRLWMGTWLEGLWIMDLKSGNCRRIMLPGEENGNAASVFGFEADKLGKLWIASNGAGLFNVNLSDATLTPKPVAVRKQNSKDTDNVIPNNWINDLCLGDNGILYMATCDGIGAIDIRTGNCTTGFKGKNQLLPGLNILTLQYTKDGRLWVGSSKGMISLNTKTLNLRMYKREDGLEGNSIQSILYDGKNALWIGTNAGITRMNLKTEEFFNYSSSNGMYSNEFSKNAAAIGNDGIMYFGGTEGVCKFKANKVSQVTDKRNLLITGLYINGKAINAMSQSREKPIMSTNILHATEIELGMADNSFTVELSTLDFAQTEDVTFEYRIDGKPWQSLPTSTNTVNFNNLKAGTHLLEFRAKNINTYSDVKSLEVTIRPVWYATWWAYLLYLAIIALAVWAVLSHLRQRYLASLNEKKLKQQEEISEAKLQFFMNISHEIRTPMTLIVSPLQRLLASDNDEKRQAAYQLMDRNAQRIMQLINQLLDVRKIDKGQMKLHFREVEMNSYVRNLAEGFRDLCDTKNIKIRFNGVDGNLMAWIDPMNFDKILVNLLANAFKFTPNNGKINVSLSEDGNSNYIIKVEDTGKGLAADEIENIFERFYQQHCSENNAVQGSGIGLNLTRSLVQMHHGEISAANNEGGPGCHFTILLPLGNAHLTQEEMEQTSAENIEQPKSSTPAADDDRQLTATGTPAEMSRKEPVKLKPLTDEKNPFVSRKQLLIVEDDEEIQKYLTVELASAFNVTCCHDGNEAIKILRHKQPDLIISDVMMPGMDGMTLLRNVRQNTMTNSVPFILLTARTSEEDNIEGLNLGADAYITKPFNIEILRRTALNLVQRHQQLKNIFDGRQTPKVDKVKVLSPDEKLMQRIMKVINANLSNPNLNNDLITREVGISRVHLYRKLKEMTNLSLRDFVKNIRLTEAARLLSEQHHSIAEIAEKTGFDNVSYFAVVFKQKYGLSPTAYMNEHHASTTSSDIGDDDTNSSES